LEAKTKIVFNKKPTPDTGTLTESMAIFGKRPRPLNGSISLADLEPGAAAVIEGVHTAAPGGQRLLDLGFVPNTPVRVLRRAPLGDPIEFELRGYRICLRHSEAAWIHVLSPDSDPARPR
jgi:ferrous iron transport protein A